jgi:hypothetical protein
VDWLHNAPGIDAPLQVPNVALDLSAAMRRNPALRVYIMGGVYDLATPFAGAEFDISHLYLGERLRRNVQFSWYESGHMTFVDEKVIPVMASDLARFYASTDELASRAGAGVGAPAAARRRSMARRARSIGSGVRLTMYWALASSSAASISKEIWAGSSAGSIAPSA